LKALRRVGRVVMQRIANPCTPVRFRYPPPKLIIDLNIIIINVLKALRVYLWVHPRVY
jgi:hypothetical protein